MPASWNFKNLRINADDDDGSGNEYDDNCITVIITAISVILTTVMITMHITFRNLQNHHRFRYHDWYHHPHCWYYNYSLSYCLYYHHYCYYYFDHNSSYYHRLSIMFDYLIVVISAAVIIKMPLSLSSYSPYYFNGERDSIVIYPCVWVCVRAAVLLRVRACVGERYCPCHPGWRVRRPLHTRRWIVTKAELILGHLVKKNNVTLSRCLFILVCLSFKRSRSCFFHRFQHILRHIYSPS